VADDSDKTEEPTDHKLQEERKKGNVFKSQEIIQTLLLLATAGMLSATGAWLFWECASFARYTWYKIPEAHGWVEGWWAECLYMEWVSLKVLLPLLVAAFIVAVIANIAQIKFLFTTQTMIPKLSKINPIEGFKRICSMKSVMELAKQLVKIGVVAWVSYKVVKNDIIHLQYGIQWDLGTTCSFIKSICTRIISYVVVAMAALSIIDFIFQRKQYMKQMKMSMNELKDEYKDTEGNPQVKGKMKQLMRQGAMGRMMEEVPNSSAVVTNPTHLAVAIRYQQGVDTAPMVVAKGERLLAMQIRVLAEDSEVPIIENIELAHALFKGAEVGQEIPVDLYKAVAEILAYVIKLKRKRELAKKRRFGLSQSRTRRAVRAR